jgi:lipopolysaccharide export LptBFGC system permease protein LptF
MTTTFGAATFGVWRHVREEVFRPGAFKHLYARRFFANVAVQAFSVMALVEAIFLAERFPMIFRDVLKNNANLFDTALLFVCNSTQIFDLALAIAILMAVYWTTLAMRENRELLVLFAAGNGPYQLVALVTAVAVAGLIGSLTVSGVIDPASRFFQREILFDAEFRALRFGINTGQFYDFPNRIAFAPKSLSGSANSGQTRRLFIFEPVKQGRFRVTTADLAHIEGPDSAGMVVVRLDGVTSHIFSDAQSSPGAGPPAAIMNERGCTNCGSQSKRITHLTLFAHDIAQQMKMDDLVTFLPRGSEADELTLFEQTMRTTYTTAPKRLEGMRLLGERFARSLLCLLAPFIALVSVCLTSRATNHLVQPLACLTLMALNLASEWLIRTIAPTYPFEALAVPAVLTAAFASLFLAAIVREQGLLVRPQLGRS